MRKKTVSPAGQIRRLGVRVHGGPWTVFVAPEITAGGRLIVALGRTAGGAVVRNRIRRIARDVYESARGGFSGSAFLLAARSDVGDVPRRRVRVAIEGLLRRGHGVLARRRTA
jgi:ribonuclease P protein component